MRAAIYVHTAGTNPALRNHQLARCKHLATTEGYHVILIVTDAAADILSNRPGLHHLRILIERQTMDALIVWDYTHLARQLDEIRTFLAFCRSHHVQIRPVNHWKGLPAEPAVGA